MTEPDAEEPMDDRPTDPDLLMRDDSTIAGKAPEEVNGPSGDDEPTDHVISTNMAHIFTQAHRNTQVTLK
jgi:hypothetical protein